MAPLADTGQHDNVDGMEFGANDIDPGIVKLRGCGNHSVVVVAMIQLVVDLAILIQMELRNPEGSRRGRRR